MTPSQPERSPPTGPRTDPASRAAQRRRRSHLLNHLIAYFAVMVILVPINAHTTPEEPWFLIPMVVWGAPLALHVAWVMDLFGNRRRR